MPNSSQPSPKSASKIATEKLPPQPPVKPGVLDSGLRWLWLALIFFIVDQWTKQMAVDYFVNPGGRFEVLSFFNLTLAYNPGAAFSFLADHDGWQIYFFATISSVVGVGLLYWLYTLPAKNRWLSIALSLIFSGAMGNLYDRVTLEKVVDFIQFYYQDYYFPSFNIADSVIFIGAAMMLFDSFANPQETDKKSGNKKTATRTTRKDQ